MRTEAEGGSTLVISRSHFCIQTSFSAYNLTRRMKQRRGAKLFALVFDHLKLRVEKIRLSLKQGDTDVFGAEGREAGSALFQP